MDANPRVSLSLLYRNDPFYTLCLADLMSASQSVTNNYLKEQRKLTETLRRIDHHQISRIGQLNEEKRQFTLMMKKKLTPKVSLLSLPILIRESRKSSSTENFTDLPSTKCSVRSFQTMSTVSIYRTVPTVSLTSNQKWINTGHIQVSRANFSTTLSRNKCECGPAPKRLTKSVSCFPNLSSENVSKVMPYEVCRIRRGA